MNIVGKIHTIMPEQQVSPTFRKREFVVEFSENPTYPQFVLFQLVQDRCEIIEAYNPGDMVDVAFNLRGRQWDSPQGETKFFNSLEAWKIAPATGGGMAEPVQMRQPQAQPNKPVAQKVAHPIGSPYGVEGEDDELPF